MVRTETKTDRCTVTGAVFPNGEIRLVRFDEYRLEAELAGINLLIQNVDKPGMIGFIGTTLGDHRINIANMHLVQSPGRDKAIAILRLEAEAPPEVLDKVRNSPDIISVRQVRL
jgi:D-3-phosphoglycerate dehydrogenase